MVVVQPEDGGATSGSGPLGARTLTPGGSAILGKQNVSVTATPIGNSFSSPDVRLSLEVHTYIRHLEGKIDNLTTIVERGRHVRDELAEIKRLLHKSPTS